MSWLALKKASATAQKATISGWEAGLKKPMVAMVAIRAPWVMSIHPRLRPRNGGINRSSSGDQRNLKA